MIEVQEERVDCGAPCLPHDPEGNRIKAIYPQGDGTNEGIYYHYDYTGMLTEIRLWRKQKVGLDAILSS